MGKYKKRASTYLTPEKKRSRRRSRQLSSEGSPVMSREETSRWTRVMTPPYQSVSITRNIIEQINDDLSQHESVPSLKNLDSYEISHMNEASPIDDIDQNEDRNMLHSTPIVVEVFQLMAYIDHSARQLI